MAIHQGQITTSTARRAFEHGGRSYVTGDLVTESSVMTAVLRDEGKVALDSDEDWRAQIHQAVTPPTRRRRSYKRRDMTAER